MNLSVPAETDTNFIRQVQINNDSRGEQNSLSCAYPNQFGYKPERARKTSTKRETPLEKSSNNQTINICKVKRVREQQLRQQPKTLLCTIFCVRVCFCVCVSNTSTATAIQTLCDNGPKEISLLSFPMNLITSAGRLLERLFAICSVVCSVWFEHFCSIEFQLWPELNHPIVVRLSLQKWVRSEHTEHLFYSIWIPHMHNRLHRHK